MTQDKKAEQYWPYPATQENKMIFQLDSVAQESETKASQIFDIVEEMLNILTDEETKANNIIKILQSNIKLFRAFNKKFPDVAVFKTKLAKNSAALDNLHEILQTLQNSVDALMSVMDILQYQDIHRQKIERVINVMRSLSRYMNTLLESRVDDKKRVSSAQHIVGDTHSELVSNDEIEILLSEFGNKNV